MKFHPFCLAAILAILLSSCASTETLRQRRVAANPEIYDDLSEEDRALLSKGQIRDGMHKKVVFLAWGRPDEIRQGSRSGVPYETWVYTANQAHSRSRLALGYGGGLDLYHPHSRGRYYHQLRFGFYPSVATTFVSIEIGSVEFLNDKVASWEVRAR